MIRLDGAADLCSSLIINTTLTYLDLSFNSLGSIGGAYYFPNFALLLSYKAYDLRKL